MQQHHSAVCKIVVSLQNRDGYYPGNTQRMNARVPLSANGAAGVVIRYHAVSTRYLCGGYTCCYGNFAGITRPSGGNSGRLGHTRLSAGVNAISALAFAPFNIKLMVKATSHWLSASRTAPASQFFNRFIQRQSGDVAIITPAVQPDQNRWTNSQPDG